MKKTRKMIMKRYWIIPVLILFFIGISHGFQYRIPIYVNSTINIYEPVNFYIELDTRSLIANQMLKSNCRDIAVYDEYNNIYPVYVYKRNLNIPQTYIWDDFVCNRTRTKILIRLPNITTEGKLLYLYFGDPYYINPFELEDVWASNRFYPTYVYTGRYPGCTAYKDAIICAGGYVMPDYQITNLTIIYNITGKFITETYMPEALLLPGAVTIPENDSIRFYFGQTTWE
ncbi:MAG: hypothetical protein QW795_08690, partial [Candidatus Bathyarchaeia archaeon]